jgi:hypothetical protein
MVVRASILLVAVSLAGCGKDDCERAYETEKKCSPLAAKLPEKDVYVLGCNAALKSDLKHLIAEEIQCAQESSCEEYLKCGKARRGQVRAKEVEKAVDAGTWKDAWDDCTLIADHYADDAYRAACVKVFKEAKLEGEDAQRARFRCTTSDEIRKLVPELEQRCREMFTAHLTSVRAAAIAARDAGVRDFKLCLDLQQAAASAGGDAEAQAKQVCEELTQAENAKQAIDEAHANLAANKTDFPFKCQFALERLAKLDTEWGKRTLEAVERACYVELGTRVLTVEPKEAKYYCPLRVRRMQETIAKRKLAEKYPELAEALKKLPRKCK